MEKKLTVIVDNKEITTEVTNTEMCSSACDVAMETCSSERYDACGDCVPLRTIENLSWIPILNLVWTRKNKIQNKAPCIAFLGD